MPQPVAERRLGTWPIFVIAVSAMTPLTVVAGALPLGYGQVEEKGIPVAYILVAAVLGVFAVGLAAMARHVPNRGAFYAYAAAGLSRPAGVGTAFVALLAYNAMQIGLYGAFGVAAHNAMAIFGIEITWVIWALLGWALIAVLGRLNIDLNARILTVLVCAEVLIVLIFDAAMLRNPAGGTVSFATLNPALIASAGGVALLVAAVAGMVGFEAPLVYAAEARDPRRTVSRAIALTLLVAAVLYGGTAWVMSVVAGPDQIVAVAADHLDDLFFFLPEPYLPAVIIDLGRIFFATSLFAAMLAFHHTVARYALTVAREGVLPSSLARTRNDVPVTASFAQSSLALGVLLLFALLTLNPTTDLFFFGTVSGGLGVLVLMLIASIAVVRYFRRGDHGETRWRRSIAPWVAAVFLGIILLLTVVSFGILLDSDNLLKVWSPPLAFLLLFIGGVRWGRKLRRERPEVYAVIGTGQPPSAPVAGGAEEDPPADEAEQWESTETPESAVAAGGTGAAGGTETLEDAGTGENTRDAASDDASTDVADSSPTAAPAPAGDQADTTAPADVVSSAVGAEPVGPAVQGASTAGSEPAGPVPTVAGETVGPAEEGESPAPRVPSPRKRTAASRTPARPADFSDDSRLLAESAETPPVNGASAAPGRTAPPRRVPRARRAPEEGTAANASSAAGSGSASLEGASAEPAAAGSPAATESPAAAENPAATESPATEETSEPTVVTPAEDVAEAGTDAPRPNAPGTPRQRSPRSRRPETPGAADADRQED
ncbi:amino acid transporter [Actinoplanes lutulentus]|uniref:Amino acid transporter n=1 Tax=Actinoplanes lutulentus TaxID=1287878 RepID=A0A327Z1D8_9ACTN|nr:amino acid permease [Actinoplanes lutulentus]MBB2943614.1 amino acid transporter [Actinoplanes lutulentus]RAK27479.1 amino acid transporter [Actinoplanes lutulentus]